jgi:acyl-CoA-binding protein
MVAQTAAFKKAVEDSRKLKAKPSDDELLQVREQWLQVKERHETDSVVQLYGLFKQGTQDPPIESSDKPGMFDLKVTPTLSIHNRDPPSKKNKLLTRLFHNRARPRETHGRSSSTRVSPPRMPRRSTSLSSSRSRRSTVTLVK